MASKDFIEKIKACGVLPLAKRCTELHKVGNLWRGICPSKDHEDNTASFTVMINKDGSESWCCYGCHAGKKYGNENFGSDNIAFIRWIYYHNKKQELSFVEAITILAKFFNIPMEYDKNNELYHINSKKNENYKSNMIPFVKEYLYSRGLDDKDISDWSIGFDGERIMFPICNTNNDIVGFSGRAFSIASIASGRKYINSSTSSIFKKSSIFFGINHIDRTSDSIFITEGQFDAIIANKYGIKNAVALMTCSLSDGHIGFIKKHSLKPILCFDSDKAGKSGMKRAVVALTAAGVKNIRLVMLPDERDLADLGKDVKNNLKNIINRCTITYSQFLLKGIADELDATIISKQQEMMPKIKEALNNITDPDEAVIAKDFINKRLHMWA